LISKSLRYGTAQDLRSRSSSHKSAVWIQNHKFKEEGSENKAVPEIRIRGGPDPDPKAFIRLGSPYQIFWIRKPFT
jgi:hypothetical protein